MPLSTILWMLSVGYRMENILKEYPGIERKQLLNALAFAAELLDEYPTFAGLFERPGIGLMELVENYESFQEE